jgi:hypothetical protein
MYAPNRPTVDATSLAATNGAASDLADNLQLILNRLEWTLWARRGEQGPVPSGWWSGYVNMPEFMRDCGGGRSPNRVDRMNFFGDEARRLIDQVRRKWPELTRSIPFSEGERIKLMAAFDGLRNISGILTELGRAPDEQSVSARLPEVFELKGPSEEEIAAEAEATDLWARSALEGNIKAQRALRARARKAQDRHLALVYSREEQNDQIAAQARREGRVSEADLADLKGLRSLERDHLDRYRLRLQHMQTLLELLASARKPESEPTPEPQPASSAERGEPLTQPKAEALDEFDVSVLEFLDRTPSLRRKIADVSPDTGPQDRKAVAKRLRKLADRTPALVDYPKGGRSGVAILPAGSAALKRMAAPTPR